MGFEFPVTVKHTVDFFHGRETAGAQSERVEHIPVAGPLHIFDGLLSEFFFFAGRVGEYVEEIEFLIKCVFSHDMIPFIDDFDLQYTRSLIYANPGNKKKAIIPQKISIRE